MFLLLDLKFKFQKKKCTKIIFAQKLVFKKKLLFERDFIGVLKSVPRSQET